MPVSEFSQKLLDAVVQDEQYIGGIDDKRSREAFDAQFQEVRAVLLLTARRVIDHVGPCWCKTYLPTLGHTEDCQRASTLYQRLQIKGVGE